VVSNVGISESPAVYCCESVIHCVIPGMLGVLSRAGGKLAVQAEIESSHIRR